MDKNIVKLNEAITAIQEQRSQDLMLLKKQFFVTYNSLMPVNIIKSTIDEVVDSSHIKGTLLGGAMGLTSGYAARKILVGGSGNIVKIILGSLLQFVVTGFVTKNASSIKVAASNLFYKYFKLR